MSDEKRVEIENADRVDAEAVDAARACGPVFAMIVRALCAKGVELSTMRVALVLPTHPDHSEWLRGARMPAEVKPAGARIEPLAAAGNAVLILAPAAGLTRVLASLAGQPVELAAPVPGVLSVHFFGAARAHTTAQLTNDTVDSGSAPGAN